MQFMELIKKRHSIRAYKSNKIESEKLEQILEAARVAPTAANRQAFKIVVISTEGRQEELKAIYNRDWFVKAPVIIGICSQPQKAWKRSDGKNYADIDAAIVMDHIVLAAADLGLGTCWIGAFDPKAAREILKLEEGLEPIAFTPIGYADQHNLHSMRKDLEEIVIYR
jgi:nitroreductase